MIRINNLLEREGPLLFTPQRVSIIANFEQTYSVHIVVREAFLERRFEECSIRQKFFELDGVTSKNIKFIVADDGQFLNASVPRLLIQTVGLPFSSALSLQSPFGKQQQIHNNECGQQSLAVNAAFTDNGIAFSGSSCNFIISGSQTYQPTQPFSLFTGEEVRGTWTASVFSSSPANAELQ